MTPAEIRALRDAATQGQWSAFDQERDPYSRGMGVTGPERDICNMSNLRFFRDEAAANAALIAAAPTLATIAADALDEVARLREAIEYVLDGYGLNAPDFKPQPEDDEEDWIVIRLRAAIGAP